jgi:hypothetical protein
MFSYEITMQNNLKLCRNVLCEVFYKRSIFGSCWTNKLGRQGLAVFPNKYSGGQKLKNNKVGLYSLENKKKYSGLT